MYYILSYLFLLLSFYLIIKYYRYLCNYYTFTNINKNYKKNIKWEKELDIYEISIGKFYTKNKKKLKCILLIGGYKDIPFVWNELENYLISDEYDFYAPRTFGNGRSFFQVVNYKDWIITYLEAIYLLQEMYETIDIISLSTGSVIALYLSQFKYKCKIKNIFLCSPFLLYKSDFSIELFFNNNIFSKLINKLFCLTFRFHPKSKGDFAGYRDTYYDYNSINDFCEIFGDVQMETTLFEFVKNFKLTKIYASNIIILYSPNDNVIGNIYTQRDIIQKVFDKQIDLIIIPSYLSNNNLPSKCGHLMFKEYPEIISDIYFNIKKYF